MSHSRLRLEAELDQLDAKYSELASGFMQQLASRAVSDGTALLCTSKILGTMCVLTQALLTRDSEDPRCMCLGCIERESRSMLEDFWRVIRWRRRS